MMVKPLFLACLTAIALPAGAAASVNERGQDMSQQAASERNKSGRNLPAREIERRVIPTMGDAQYLGFVFDQYTDIYTLKFLRNGSVIWLDVDGRTGRIVRRTGN